MLKPKILTYLISITLIAGFIFYNDGLQYHLGILGLFFLSCCICLIPLVFDKEPNYLNSSVLFFYLFFFGVAPAMQYKQQSIFFDAPTLTNHDYGSSGILILASLITYIGIYYFVQSKHFSHDSKLLPSPKKASALNFKHLLVGAFCIIIVLLLLKYPHYEFLWNREAFNVQETSNYDKITNLLVQILRTIPLTFCFMVWYNKQDRFKHISFKLLCIISVLLLFPTSLTRANVAIYYVPVALLFLNYLNATKWYRFIFALAVLLLFPLWNFFRKSNNEVFLGVENFTTGHFDAFQNFTLLVKEEMITHGNQLLGTIMFFVPRTYWPEKPLGTGAMLAEHLGFSWTNIAMPFIGEGYANFGYIGVFLFIGSLAVINAILDKQYTTQKMAMLTKILYVYFIGFEFYLMRGDLMSSFYKLLVICCGIIGAFLILKIMDWFKTTIIERT